MQKFCIIAREWGEGGIKGVLTLPYNPYSPFSTFRYEESSEQATIAFQKFLKIQTLVADNYILSHVSHSDVGLIW